jgi:DNA polymerase IV
MSIWTRFTHRSSSAMIRNLRARPVVVAWKGNDLSSAPLPTRRGLSECDRLCPLAAPNAYVLLPSSSLRILPVIVTFQRAAGSLPASYRPDRAAVARRSLLGYHRHKAGLPTATPVARTIREQIRHELKLTASAGVAPNLGDIVLDRVTLRSKESTVRWVTKSW